MDAAVAVVLSEVDSIVTLLRRTKNGTFANATLALE